MRMRGLGYGWGLGLVALACWYPWDGEAATSSLSGGVAVEVRWFPDPPAWPGQRSEAQVSVVVEPDIRARSDDRTHQFRLVPFLRVDSLDDRRTHADLRQAYWRYAAEDWQVLTGIHRVFWGVAESRHLVDIINQTDGVEDIDEEDKLGQPMVLWSRQVDWGELQLFLLPLFRERTFPGSSGRLRIDPPVSKRAEYESGAEDHRLDAAIRYAHSVGPWDIGASYFYGTSREPLLLPSPDGAAWVPRYEVIHQSGFDLQHTHNAWLWKMEAILREGHGDPFVAAVAGLEVSWYQLAASRMDLGLLLEYAYDGRDPTRAPPTLFDDDVFFGGRLSLNDTQTTEVLAGAVFDRHTSATLGVIEATRRLGDTWSLALDARFFFDFDQDPISWYLADDSFVNLGIRRNF